MLSKLFPLLILSIFLTGCFEIEEVIELRKDGSGTYQLKVDYSQVLQLTLMMNQEDEDLEDQFSDTDEIFSIAEANPDAAKTTKHPDFWKKVKTRVIIDRATEQMFVTFYFDFDKADEINYFVNEISSFTDDLTWFSSDQKQVSVKGKKLQRLATIGLKNLIPDTPEDLEMTRMFMEEAVYKTTYILPGNVKSSSIKNSVISGNTVSVEHRLLGVIDDESIVKGTIKFKKK